MAPAVAGALLVILELVMVLRDPGPVVKAVGEHRAGPRPLSSHVPVDLDWDLDPLDLA